MTESSKTFTRRDFLKTTGCAAIGVAVGLPALAQETAETAAASKAVLVRHPDVINAAGAVDADIIAKMLDDAVTTLFGKDDPVACWKEIIRPDDIVGIKTNVWPYLRTPPELERAIAKRVTEAGVPGKNISIDDRGVLSNPLFKNSTALINSRPMRTHAWSGVGSLIKNYIMFVPYPQNYHGNSCANLGAIWTLPICKDKTRLNILVMLTPLFYGVGAHHFDTTYVWGYKGLIVSTDPVAADTVGLRIFQAKRAAYFGEDKPIKPSAHHIAIAGSKYNLGTGDLNKIELIKLGWQEDILI